MKQPITSLKHAFIFTVLASVYAPVSVLASSPLEQEPQARRPFHSPESLDEHYQEMRLGIPEINRPDADNFYQDMRTISLDIRGARISPTLTFQERLHTFSTSTNIASEISRNFLINTNSPLSSEARRAINGCTGYFFIQENALFLEYLSSEIEIFLRELASFKETPLRPLERESFKKAHDLLSRYEAIRALHKNIFVEPTYSFLKMAQSMSQVQNANPLMSCAAIATQFGKPAEDLLYKFTYGANLKSYVKRLDTLDEAQRLDFYNYYGQLSSHAQAIEPYEGNSLNNLLEVLELLMVYTKLPCEDRSHFQLLSTSTQQRAISKNNSRDRPRAARGRLRALQKSAAPYTVASMRADIASHLLENARKNLATTTERYASLLDRDAFTPINTLYERFVKTYELIQLSHVGRASSSSSQSLEPNTQPLVSLQQLLADMQDAQNTLREAFHAKSMMLAATRIQDSEPQAASSSFSSTPAQPNMRSAVIDAHIKAGKLTPAAKHKPKKGQKKNKGKGKRRS
jgi:hypothetical protein